MRPLAALLAVLMLPVSAYPQSSSDDARPRDIQRLQDDVANLDEDLRALEAGDPKTEAFRRRAEDIRDELTYLKVKMRRHRRAGGGDEGTGVGYDEVADVGRAVADLREDMDRAFRGADRRGEVRLAEGAQILVRLEQPLSSRTARREDRVEATVFRPVRAEGVRALPAGTRVRGVVRQAEPAQRPSKGGRLELDFDAIYLDRTRLDLAGRVIAVEEDADREEKAGVGAVLGGVLGGILGGRRGALVGILLGSTGAVVGSKGNDVELPSGTILTVRLDRPVVIPRR